MSPYIFLAIVLAIGLRVYTMKGYFTMPQYYIEKDEKRFNLGSIATILIGIAAALSMAYAMPESFSNPLIAGITAYTAPQLVDVLISKETTNSQDFIENEDEEEGV
jgi:hypothetical protein